VRRLGQLLAVAALVAGCSAPAERTAEAPAASPSEPRVIAVTVGESGFQPSSIEVRQGERVELAFTRTTDATCATAAVFEQGERHDLPLNQEVRVAVPTDSAGTVAWACPMGMYRSTVTVR
jgi:plastocyanin domain-containing protein